MGAPTRAHIRLTAHVLAALLAAAVVVQGGRADARIVEGCRPELLQPPRGFHRQVVRAIRISGDLPRAWGDSPFIADIICWQGTDFRTRFRERGRPRHVYHGMFAMTIEELQTIAGPWMTANRFGVRLTPRCFLRGWEVCSHTGANRAFTQQMITGLRWIWLNHGDPRAAWNHIRSMGRFNSYPRPGTNDAQTRAPFRVCPVAPRVHYRDDFGERRTVGGYHPHWGNDMIAPTGRAIRAPFEGFAVARSDNWFGGMYVTVIGEHGYVRNGHLSRFAKRGHVKAGAIVGYVGATGDARGPHDHFEWHPWVVPTPLHRAPSGFRRVMDAIDPYPFLNKVCGGRGGQLAPHGSEQPIGE